MRSTPRYTSLPIFFWMALILVVPLAAVFVLSLAAATLLGAAALAVYVLLRPRGRRPLPRRPPAPPRGDEIELDKRDYRRIPSDRPTE